MRIIGSSEVHGHLDYEGLVEALRVMFRGGVPDMAGKPQAFGEVSGGASLAIEPAWLTGRGIGVRVSTDFPDNPEKDLPRRLSNFLLLDGRTGVPRAIMDGGALTLRRTAAASALAASYLARPDSERLLVIGTGALATQLVEAHIRVRPIRNVLIWGRDADKAARMAHRLDRRRLKVTSTTDLAGAVAGAHVITCATSAATPIIKGEWLPLGVHLDLAGGVTPDMREADDDCISRARVFVDFRDGPVMACGDISQPLNAGRLTLEDIAGDFYELTRGSRAGRRYYEQITVFKSAGLASEDLVAAMRLMDALKE